MDKFKLDRISIIGTKSKQDILEIFEYIRYINKKNIDFLKKVLKHADINDEYSTISIKDYNIINALKIKKVIYDSNRSFKDLYKNYMKFYGYNFKPLKKMENLDKGNLWLFTHNLAGFVQHHDFVGIMFGYRIKTVMEALDDITNVPKELNNILYDYVLYFKDFVQLSNDALNICSKLLKNAPQEIFEDNEDVKSDI